MLILLATVFIASVLGSLHCVGMCGPFALLAATTPERKSASLVATMIYSLGRLSSYAVVGLVFGGLGLALNKGTSFAPWQQTATYVAGTLMIVVGVIALLRHFGIQVRLPGFASVLQNKLQGFYKIASSQSAHRRAFLIGALSSLMPCGWLYTFAIVAAGTGSPLTGVLVMTVFWSGTLPIMVALAIGFGRLGIQLQKRVPLMMASLVIVMGIFTISVRAPVAIGSENNVVSDTAGMIQQIHEVDQENLPCCSGETH